ncbi:MAG TPA: HAMP domain-containing sensor histidine kinase, partial [Terriglobia bacterium]|nr:HAMP domain-containing sensor histidine kinase [Terriglobia bacterium]
QLSEQNRYRAERAAFVTHDLKTPLAAIHTAFLLLQAQPTPQTLGEILPLVRRNIARMDSLIGRFVEQEKAPETSPNLESREVDLWPIVQGLVNDLDSLAGAASTTITNCIDRDMIVYADAMLVSQIFQNLLSNAIKYTNGGRIEVGASLLENGCIQSWVRDNGVGIPADRLPTVFEKYETDGAGGGTGLGLAIVRQAVEAHGGKITVESQQGHGTVFRFVLPGVDCKTLPLTRSPLVKVSSDGEQAAR